MKQDVLGRLPNHLRPAHVITCDLLITCDLGNHLRPANLITFLEGAGGREVMTFAVTATLQQRRGWGEEGVGWGGGKMTFAVTATLQQRCGVG